MEFRISEFRDVREESEKLKKEFSYNLEKLKNQEKKISEELEKIKKLKEVDKIEFNDAIFLKKIEKKVDDKLQDLKKRLEKLANKENPDSTFIQETRNLLNDAEKNALTNSEFSELKRISEDNRFSVNFKKNSEDYKKILDTHKMLDEELDEKFGKIIDITTNLEKNTSKLEKLSDEEKDVLEKYASDYSLDIEHLEHIDNDDFKMIQKLARHKSESEKVINELERARKFLAGETEEILGELITSTEECLNILKNTSNIELAMKREEFEKLLAFYKSLMLKAA